MNSKREWNQTLRSAPSALALAFMPLPALAMTVVSFETIDIPAQHNAVHSPMGVNGVSANGSVVVGWFNTGIDTYSTETESFILDEDTLIHPVDLGLSAIVAATAADVSADGIVIVGTLTTESGIEEAYRLQNGVVTRLGFLPGAADSRADAISADGSVVVGSSGDIAFRWEDGIMTSLGELPGGELGSRARAVSADGAVVVGYSNSTLGEHEAFRWEDGVLTGLGFNGFYSFAVSADGSVIVGAYADSPPLKAFRLVEDTLTYLEWDDESASGAISVSPDGSLVIGFNGWSWHGGSGAIWSQDNDWETISLDALVDESAFDREGFRLFSPITGDGSTLVGYALNNRSMRLYRLRVAEKWNAHPIETIDGVEWVDAEDWLGWVCVEHAPWIYCLDLEAWLYLSEDSIGETGAWAFIAK